MFSDRTNWKLTRNRFTKAWEEVRAAGREVLDLTISNPTRAGFDYDEAAILAALSSPRAMDYDPQPKGLLEAREAVSGYYGEQHATTELDPERFREVEAPELLVGREGVAGRARRLAARGGREGGEEQDREDEDPVIGGKHGPLL